MAASRPSTAGTLYIVSTPIGNLRDITLRALDVLRETRVIAAEDTRNTQKLLAAFDLHAKLFSFHANSPERRIETLLARLYQGEDIAYLTDAGSPAVSDPGMELVAAAVDRDITVTVLPGPSAVTTALALSGLQTADFRFLGFPPRSRSKRENLIREASASGCALVLFESPRRVRDLLESLQTVLPHRKLAACRELTKVHEEVLRGAPADILRALDTEPRGEFTLVIEMGTPASPEDELDKAQVIEEARRLRNQGLSTREAARKLSQSTALSKKDVYRLIVADEKTKQG